MTTVTTARDAAEISAPAKLHGEVSLPGDKSITHRAILLNAMAEGEARISQAGLGADCMRTVQCLRSLGVDIQFLSDTDLLIRSSGSQGMQEPDEVLDCGNAGTAMRLLLGLVAGLDAFSVLSGDASLRRRPMSRVTNPLRLMGAEIYGRNGGENPPIAVNGGRLEGIEFELPVASAQVKSALLIAGMIASGETTIRQPALSRNHTELMLATQGVQIDANGLTLTIKGGQRPNPIDVRVPRDVSSAAFWLTAGAIHPQADLMMPGVSINPTRAGVIDVLRRMGAQIDIIADNNGTEPTAGLRVRSSRLHATRIDGEQVPIVQDEIPILALAATQAEGRTEIRDAQELRIKESDRISTTCRELNSLGANVEELADGLIIEGPTPLNGAVVDSHDDHRLAMCLGVAGLVADGTTTVLGADSASVSYPSFWPELARLSLNSA
ncbi:MAG: 3-phosphoshikimate 1-carboxyvinyltransferase [Chloroflexi bacterium]|nr:3-phosphoshikimate 1-carboxyvinyltransferase [Chloroflexota bacterium]MCY3937690.1 3-phosphoshikimate 1-carboxyvinyltransferase [Chloroflexota bacterium]